MSGCCGHPRAVRTLAFIVVGGGDSRQGAVGTRDELGDMDSKRFLQQGLDFEPFPCEDVCRGEVSPVLCTGPMDGV